MKTLPQLSLAIFIAIVLSVVIPTKGLNAGQTKTSRPAQPKKENVREREARESSEELGESESDEVFRREQYIHDRRAGGPGRVIPPGAYANAVRENAQLASKASRKGIDAALPAWQSASQGGLYFASGVYVSGRTNSIAVSPRDTNVMYLATAGGGVWKTTDRGTVWSPITSNLSTMASGAIALNPVHPDTVYWGTGEQNFSFDSYFGDGLFRSLNGGATWTRILSAGTASYYSDIVIDPVNPLRVYAACDAGVLRSTNGGSTWTNPGIGTQATVLIMNPLNRWTLYAVLGGTGANKVKKTTDGGNTWTQLPFGGVGSLRLAMAIAPSDTNVLYIGCDINGDGTGGVYRSSNGGAGWVLQNHTTDYTGMQSWYDNALTVKPTDPNYVIVGGLDEYTSTNGGVTFSKRSVWQGVTPGFTHADIHRLIYFGSTLFTCSDGGIYASADDGLTQAFLNTSLTAQQYQGADYDAHDPNIIAGGLQDNGKARSLDGGVTTFTVGGGDGGYTLIDPDSGIYHYSQYVNGTLDRSNTGGDGGWTRIQPPTPGTYGGLFYNPFEMAPGDPNTMLYGTTLLFKSSDVRHATTSSGWTQIPMPVTGAISAIGISNTNTSKYYIGNGGGDIGFEASATIFATTNDGANWTTASLPAGVNDIAVDKVDDNIAYAALGGFAARVYKTTNGGANWTNIDGNLPHIPIYSIVVRQTAPRMIIIGSDMGVYYTIDEGTTWAPLNNGFPTAAVFDLKYKEGPKMLLAATHGRGLYKLDMSGFAFAPSRQSISFGSLHAGLSAMDSVTVTNNGSSTLNITSVVSGDPSVTVTPSSAAINVGDSVKFYVTFAPVTFGAVSTNLTFTNDGVTSPDVITVTGTGQTSVYSGNKTHLNFGNVRLGSTKLDSIVVTNPGNLMLHISSISSSDGAFVLSTSADSIPAGGHKSFYCTFDPSAPQPYSGDIVFVHDGMSGADTARADGGGAVATVNVSVLLDVDGNPATTGDQVPKSWTLSAYKDSVSPSTLQKSTNASSFAFNFFTSGTYIIVQADSGAVWTRSNGNGTFADTVVLADNQTLATTFIDMYSGSIFQVADRWNIVSVPVVRANFQLSSIFPNAVTNAFRFDSTAGYFETNLLAAGRGYWLKFSGAQSARILGPTIDRETIAVANGWNLVGSISSRVLGSEVESDPAGIISSLFWGYAGGYFPADTIAPGMGYWVNTTQPGSLYLVKENGPAFAPKTSASALLKEFNSLTFTDANGSMQKLYFGYSQQPLPNAHYFAMPPTAPAGSFDVRFASQALAEIIDPTAGEGKDHRIMLSSAAYPVNVSWNFTQKVQPFTLTGGAVSASLDRLSGSVTISDASVKSLVLRPGQAVVPLAYGLKQNYPNPFNPSTSISYQIPEESRVTLKVFNVIGQEVRTLVSGVQGAGFKAAEWDGTDNRGTVIPTGLYFYRLDAVSTVNPEKTFTQVKKMMLVK